MKWFKELKTGQKVLLIINVVLAVALFVLLFSGAGNMAFFAIGILISFINCFSIAFAKVGFQFGIAINTENAGDDVEPSGFKYMDWYINWTFSTLVVIGMVICGFVFK